jgi:DNA-binding winged helix-turn-helix (wHTH) protein
MLLSDFYEFVAGHLVYMQFHDEATTNFWISYLRNLTGKNFSKATREEMLRLTGGYGRLTKLAIETFLGPIGLKGNIEELLLSQAPIQVALTKIWLEFTPAEQSDILHNTFEDPLVDWYLEDCGFVKNKKIQIPLFESFVKASQTIAHVESEKITYDENTDTIRKGKLVLSDNLTSSEFRLLRYLWQNQERVVERDEIISIVWSNVKSKAGITDQAVDQLIFRLRRKIEEDPNKPLYLQTVKGRGFRFIS